MSQKILNISQALGSLGLAAGVWFVNQTSPKAPEWLLISMLFSAALLIAIAGANFIVELTRKPDQKIVNEFSTLNSRANELLQENIKDIGIGAIFFFDAKEWAQQAENLVNSVMNQDDLFMFKTLNPLINNTEDVEVVRRALEARVKELRLIAAKYIKGENLA